MLGKIESILAVLDRAIAPSDMDLPGFRLQSLKADRRGFWAVGFWAMTVKSNWRVIWRHDGADAVDVQLIDYH
jgi:addiction module HigA family antidote